MRRRAEFDKTPRGAHNSGLKATDMVALQRPAALDDSNPHGENQCGA